MKLFKEVKKIIVKSKILENQKAILIEDESYIELHYDDLVFFGLSAEKISRSKYKYKLKTVIDGNEPVEFLSYNAIIRSFECFCSKMDEVSGFYRNCQNIYPDLKMNPLGGSNTVKFQSSGLVISIYMDTYVRPDYGLYSCDVELDVNGCGADTNKIRLSYYEGNDLRDVVGRAVSLAERGVNNIGKKIGDIDFSVLNPVNDSAETKEKNPLSKQEILNIVVDHLGVILSPGVMTIKKLDRSEMVRKELNRYYDKNFNAIETFEEALAKHGVYFVKDGPDFIGGENNEFVKELIEIHDKHNRDFLLINLSEFAARHGLYYSGI